MKDANQPERYALSTIQRFVSQQHEQISEEPLTAYQIQDRNLFTDIPERPDKPLDLLYLLKNGTKQTPALGFQQVDTEQDEEEMFALAYLEPSLREAWLHLGA